MSRERRKRSLKESKYVTPSVVVAFEAAFKLYQEWESPEGPAVVTEVDCLVGGKWRIHYRLLSQWGKEAWK